MKNVTVESTVINVNCADCHQELMIKFKWETSGMTEYSVAIYRYDSSVNKMKVVFSFPVASIGDGSAPDSFNYISCGIKDTSCIDSIWIQRGVNKKDLSDNTLASFEIFELKIIPESSQLKYNYVFDKRSNNFKASP